MNDLSFSVYILIILSWDIILLNLLFPKYAKIHIDPYLMFSIVVSAVIFIGFLRISNLSRQAPLLAIHAKRGI